MGAQANPTSVDPAVATPAHQEQHATNAVDAWADSVLGGLEDHPPCQHCLIFKDPPILSYRKGRSLKDILVRAKLRRSTITPIDQWESCLACLFY